MKLTKISVIFILLIVGILTLKVQNNKYYDYVQVNNDIQQVISPYDGLVKGNTMEYSFILPDEISSEDTLAFYTIHTEVEAFIDGKLMYGLYAADDSVVKSTGYNWNIISIDSNYANSEMVIKISNQYNDKTYTITGYYGGNTDIFKMFIYESLFNYILSFGTIFLGCVLIGYVMIIKKFDVSQNSLKYLGYIGIVSSIWFLALQDPNSTILLDGSEWRIISMSALAILPISIICYINEELYNKKSRACNIFYWIVISEVLIQIILQLFKIVTLDDTLFITHTIIIVECLFIINALIKKIRYLGMGREGKISLITTIYIVVMVVGNLIIYKFYEDITSIPIISLMFYILIVMAKKISDLKKIKEKEEHNEIYKKLAYIDGLSRHYNRAALQNDLLGAEKNCKNLGAVIIDINNLKKCNDLYGHQAGDEYIVTVARIILNIFSDIGRCYRYGGDEFCVLLRNNGDRAMKNRIKMLEDCIRKENLKKKDFIYGIAVGYAYFDETVDEDFESTINRADMNMYLDKKNKKELNIYGDASTTSIE